MEKLRAYDGSTVIAQALKPLEDFPPKYITTSEAAAWCKLDNAWIAGTVWGGKGEQQAVHLQMDHCCFSKLVFKA